MAEKKEKKQKISKIELQIYKQWLTAKEDLSEEALKRHLFTFDPFTANIDLESALPHPPMRIGVLDCALGEHVFNFTDKRWGMEFLEGPHPFSLRDSHFINHALWRYMTGKRRPPDAHQYSQTLRVDCVHLDDFHERVTDKVGKISYNRLYSAGWRDREFLATTVNWLRTLEREVFAQGGGDRPRGYSMQKMQTTWIRGWIVPLPKYTLMGLPEEVLLKAVDDKKMSLGDLQRLFKLTSHSADKDPEQFHFPIQGMLNVWQYVASKDWELVENIAVNNFHIVTKNVANRLLRMRPPPEYNDVVAEFEHKMAVRAERLLPYLRTIIDDPLSLGEGDRRQKALEAFIECLNPGNEEKWDDNDDWHYADGWQGRYVLACLRGDAAIDLVHLPLFRPLSPTVWLKIATQLLLRYLHKWGNRIWFVFSESNNDEDRMLDADDIVINQPRVWDEKLQTYAAQKYWNEKEQEFVSPDRHGTLVRNPETKENEMPPLVVQCYKWLPDFSETGLVEAIYRAHKERFNRTLIRNFQEVIRKIDQAKLSEVPTSSSKTAMGPKRVKEQKEVDELRAALNMKEGDDRDVELVRERAVKAGMKLPEQILKHIMTFGGRIKHRVS